MNSVSPEAIVPESYGFCGGVAAADQLVERVALEANAAGIAVYGLHQIVHNADVVRKHEENGVQFVDDIADIPPHTVAIISAHGVGPEVTHAIQETGSEVFDATCPLVTHTHKGVKLAREYEEKVIYVCHGKPGVVDKLHDEVAGMVGHLDFRLTPEGELVRDPVDRTYLDLHEDMTQIEDLLSGSEKYRIITQTTLHSDEALAYREQVKTYIVSQQPDAQVTWSNKGDVCEAVSSRQKGVATLVDIRPKRIVVATDPGSKNGMGYAKLAEQLVQATGQDTEVVTIATAEEAASLEPVNGATAITASASTPHETIKGIALALGFESIQESKEKPLILQDAKPHHIDAKLRTLQERIQAAHE